MAAPNTVEYFVFRALINYPTIFKTREDVLIHAFLVNGNGMAWHPSGYMGSKFRDKKRTTIEEAIDSHNEELANALDKNKEGFAHYPDDEFTHDMMQGSVDSIHIRYAKEADVIRNAATLAVTVAEPTTVPLDYYSGGFDMQYSEFFSAPFNVKSDWLEAMHQIVEYLKIKNTYYECYVAWLKAFELQRIKYDAVSWKKAQDEIHARAVEIYAEQKKLKAAEEAAAKITQTPPSAVKRVGIDDILERLQGK